jgi:hypothetical protein
LATFSEPALEPTAADDAARRVVGEVLDILSA